MAKKKNTIKVIGVVENNHITGMQYGLIDVQVFPEHATPSAPYAFKASTIPGPVRVVQTPIRQPALKWANKISAAKKHFLDEQKQKQK
jgi:hypothetical protein